MTAQEKMTNKITGLGTKQLKEIAIEMMEDYSDTATIIFDEILGELSKRMPEQEFISFAESL